MSEGSPLRRFSTTGQALLFYKRAQITRWLPVMIADKRCVLTPDGVMPDDRDDVTTVQPGVRAP
jgi:hypothetical protein